MTERHSLVRCAVLGTYCIIGTDYPCARVFDSSRSALVATVEEPQRGHLVNASSVFATTLTSVALGTQPRTATAASSAAKGKKKSTAVSDVADDALSVFYAAMGLSNGTVVLHNVTHDEPVDHIAVSETQHALVSMVFEGNYLFCLSANCVVYVVDVARRQCVLRGRCQVDASSLAVAPVAASTKAGEPVVFRVLVSGPTMAVYEASLQTSLEGEDGQQVQRGLFRKLVSFASQGSRVDFSWLSSRASLSSAAVPAITASAQEGTIRVWDVREDPKKTTVSATVNGSNPEKNSKNGESAAHVASVLVARCRRTLLCGQRMANIAVLEGEAHCFVAATTVTGSLLLWDLARGLLPGTVEMTPIAPHYVFVSDAPVTMTSPKAASVPRLLYGAIAQAVAAPALSATGADDNVRLDELRLVLLHGRFALPRFSAVRVGALLDAHREVCESMTPQQVRAAAAAAASRAALGFFHAASGSETQDTQVITLPVQDWQDKHAQNEAEALARGRPTTGSDAAFATADSVWLQQQQQLAAKAASTTTESFKAVHTFHAASMKELPIKQMTLEERLRRLSNEAAAAAASTAKFQSLAKASREGGDEDDAVMRAEDEAAAAAGMGVSDRTHSASLGLATVPLYQALHAGDTAAVMELLSVAGRSAEGMKATILSLQLPYVLQLLTVLSVRLGIVSHRTTTSSTGGGNADDAAVVGGGGASVSTRSPLLAWVDAIVRYRGMEMYATQQELAHGSATASQKHPASHDNGEENNENSNEDAHEAAASATKKDGEDAPFVSPPRDFLAPILHQYRSLCGQYDKLATLYGRMSIFNAVRPSERSSFVNRAPMGSANSNLELVRDGRRARGSRAGGSGTSDAASKLHKLYGHGDVLMEDIAFPATFKEVRTYKSGARVVRVRNRVTREKRQHAEINSDRALLRRARRLAAEKSAGSGGGLLESDDDAEEDDMMMKAMLEANDGEMDLEALEENMRLDSDDDDDDDASDNDEEENALESDDEEDLDGDLHDRKRHRKEAKASQQKKSKRTASDVMLADADANSSDDDADAMELDSSEAEFSQGSDDEVHSDVLDFSEDEKGSSSSDDDNDAESSGSDREEGEDEKNEDSADEDDEDGMGDDMQALLEEEGVESAAERRKHKRVRLD